ncbi:MAG: hypothetical protein AB7O24_00670 [Kofleriaceae bacterium]
MGTEVFGDEDTEMELDDPTGVYFWTERPESDPQGPAFAPTEVSPVVVMLAHPRLIPRALREPIELTYDIEEDIVTASE